MDVSGKSTETPRAARGEVDVAGAGSTLPPPETAETPRAASGEVDVAGAISTLPPPKTETKSEAPPKVDAKSAPVGTPPKTDTKPEIVATPTETAAKPEIVASPAESSAKPLPEHREFLGSQVPASEPLELVVEAIRDVDVTVFLDGGGVPRERSLQAGETKRWMARKLFLVSVTDAGAVRLFLQGEDLGVPGPDREPLKLGVVRPRSR
jgi:hypothetical protein